MRKKILICGLEAVIYWDNEGNAYVCPNLGWFDRFRGLDIDCYFLTMGKKVDDASGLIRLDSLFHVKETVFIPDVTLLNLFPAFIETWRKVKKVIKDVDGIMLRYQGFYVSIPCYFARKYKKKALLEIGGNLWDALWNHGILGKIIALPVHLMCKYDMKHADYAHYVTHEYLQRVYPTSGIELALSNVELKPFMQDTLTNRLQKISQRQESDIVLIGTAAAVNVKYKGQQYVIQALSILKQMGLENYQYEIVGKGDNSYLKQTAIEYGVENQVVFKGTMSHDEIFDWLDNLDIYIQPSLQEGLPRAMVEAMSRALPCIGANTAGIPELIDRAFIYNDKKSPKVISEVILKLINELGNQASKNFEKSKDYDFDIVKIKRTNFYHRFIDAL